MKADNNTLSTTWDQATEVTKASARAAATYAFLALVGGFDASHITLDPDERCFAEIRDDVSLDYRLMYLFGGLCARCIFDQLEEGRPTIQHMRDAFNIAYHEPQKSDQYDDLVVKAAVAYCKEQTIVPIDDASYDEHQEDFIARCELAMKRNVLLLSYPSIRQNVDNIARQLVKHRHLTFSEIPELVTDIRGVFKAMSEVLDVQLSDKNLIN